MSQISSSSSNHVLIQSKNDNQKFTIDRKVVDSSALLKNICDITDITGPVIVNCPGDSLEVFIKLINHYHSLNDEHDLIFEKSIYNSFISNNNSNEKLIKLIQDLCILDSDFFLDSIADFILGIFEGNTFTDLEMEINAIQNYLGLEDDFSYLERAQIQRHKQKYFFSFNFERIKFPFKNKSFYSLKTKFSTPMNVLLERIIQRSNEKTTYLLSLINKTLKNEIDRNPFKVTDFHIRPEKWILRINFAVFSCDFIPSKNNIHYLQTMEIRKMIAKNLSIHYDEYEKYMPSLNFVISKTAEIFFKNFNSIYLFDIQKCPSISSIIYIFGNVKENRFKFEELYQHLIAKDFTKRIEIRTFDKFNFFSSTKRLCFSKKPNSPKFEILEIYDHKDIYPEFINFVKNYMENDGIIKSRDLILGIPTDAFIPTKIDTFYNYPVSVLQAYLTCIVTK